MGTTVRQQRQHLLHALKVPTERKQKEHQSQIVLGVLKGATTASLVRKSAKSVEPMLILLKEPSHALVKVDSALFSTVTLPAGVNQATSSLTTKVLNEARRAHLTIANHRF